MQYQSKLQPTWEGGAHQPPNDWEILEVARKVSANLEINGNCGISNSQLI